MPQAFYTDPALFAFDMAEVFTNSWLFVAFEAELPVPGSYLALTIGRNPIILVRGSPGPYSSDAEDFVIRFACRYRAQLRMRLPDGSMSGC